MMSKVLMNKRSLYNKAICYAIEGNLESLKSNIEESNYSKARIAASLLSAIRHNHIDLVKYLVLDAEAVLEPHYYKRKHQTTPLELAFSKRNMECFELLVDNIDIEDIIVYNKDESLELAIIYYKTKCSEGKSNE